MTLNCWSSCLHLPSAGIEGESHHSHQSLKHLEGFCSLYLRRTQKGLCVVSVTLGHVLAKGKEDENLFTVPLFSVKDTNIYKFLCHFKLTSEGREVSQVTSCSQYLKAVLRCSLFFPVLKIKPRTSCMLSKCRPRSRSPQPSYSFKLSFWWLEHPAGSEMFFLYASCLEPILILMQRYQYSLG